MSCRILKWAADYLVNFNRVQVWSSMIGPWTDWHGLVVDISENTVQKYFDYYWIIIVVAPKFLHICPVNDKSVGDEGIIRKDSLITPTNDDNAQWWHMTIPGVVEYWFKIWIEKHFFSLVTPAVLMRTNSLQSQLDCFTVSLHSPLSILYTRHQCCVKDCQWSLENRDAYWYTIWSRDRYHPLMVQSIEIMRLKLYSYWYW